VRGVAFCDTYGRGILCVTRMENCSESCFVCISMDVYMYVYMYIHMYAYMYMYIYIYIIYVYIYIRIHLECSYVSRVGKA